MNTETQHYEKMQFNNDFQSIFKSFLAMNILLIEIISISVSWLTSWIQVTLYGGGFASTWHLKITSLPSFRSRGVNENPNDSVTFGLS